jgi:transposase
MVSRKPHPPELPERAVQMVFELRAETGEARGSIARVGHRLGINTETLRNWVNKADGLQLRELLGLVGGRVMGYA